MKASMKKKAAAMLEAIKEWGQQHPDFLVDYAKECEEDWTHDRAWFTLSVEPWSYDDNPFMDYDAAHDDLLSKLRKIAGRSLVFRRGDDGKMKDGLSYMTFYGHMAHGEIELYRMKKKKGKR